MKKNQVQNDLKALIMDNLAGRYKELFGKPLPAILDSREVEALGIRPRTSLDKDAANGTGLEPLPGSGGRGKPRQYLLSLCIDTLAQDRSLSHPEQTN